MTTFEFHEMAQLSSRCFSDLEQKKICFQYPVKINSEKDTF